MYSASINVSVTTHHRGNISPRGGKGGERRRGRGRQRERTKEEGMKTEKRERRREKKERSK